MDIMSTKRTNIVAIKVSINSGYKKVRYNINILMINILRTVLLVIILLLIILVIAMIMQNIEKWRIINLKKFALKIVGII